MMRSKLRILFSIILFLIFSPILGQSWENKKLEVTKFRNDLKRYSERHQEKLNPFLADFREIRRELLELLADPNFNDHKKDIQVTLNEVENDVRYFSVLTNPDYWKLGEDFKKEVRNFLIDSISNVFEDSIANLQTTLDQIYERTNTRTQDFRTWKDRLTLTLPSLGEYKCDLELSPFMYSLERYYKDGYRYLVVTLDHIYKTDTKVQLEMKPGSDDANMKDEFLISEIIKTVSGTIGIDLAFRLSGDQQIRERKWGSNVTRVLSIDLFKTRDEQEKPHVLGTVNDEQKIQVFIRR